jgi:quercetin dioxygenase-like cupin family protein
MKWKIFLFAVPLLALPGVQLIAQQGGDEARQGHEKAEVYAPAEIQWTDGPPSLPKGAQYALLEGDPRREEMFVMRVKLPDGYHVPAHTHPKVGRVTVIQGAVNVGIGVNAKKEDAKALAAGTFATWPAGMVHAVWAEGETVLQFHGMGPWAIHYVNPDDDPRKK